MLCVCVCCLHILTYMHTYIHTTQIAYNKCSIHTHTHTHIHTYIHTYITRTNQASLSFLDRHPSLLSSVASIARTWTTLPRQVSTSTDYLFDQSTMWSRTVQISDGGLECRFADAMVMLGPVLKPNSGVHYVEFEILR